MTPRTFLAISVTTVMVASGLLLVSPATAAVAMPRILLKGGAAQVSRTYTATPTSRIPGSPRYQWYRGSKDASPSSFYKISGATGRSYTLKDADHRHTVKVIVKAVRDGRVVGTRESAPSNWIMLNLTPPVLHGRGLVGETIEATLGAWTQEWYTRLRWRRTGVVIQGERSRSYRARPADAGKEISLLAYGSHTFANGVYALDRKASRMRIAWHTRAILKGASPSSGRLNMTAIPYATHPAARQAAVRGRVAIYDGDRMIARTWLRDRKVLRFTGLRRGYHNIKMVFVSNPWYAGSRTTRTFYVR